jgi:hypothetical protein
LIYYVLIAVAVLFLGWVLLNMKKSRRDGVPLGKVHPYRRLMAHVMLTRNESVVYFDDYVEADALLEYLARAKTTFGADMSHCCVAAAAIALAENPSMNMFVSGRRLYKRNGRWISFSMKRKALSKKAKIAVVKKQVQDGETFRGFVQRVNDEIDVQRSKKRTHADKEYDLFTLMPRPLLNWAVILFRWLDYHNILPNAFIETDGMYASIFVANLGSLKMRAGYHHLYEWGNCPLFMMVGMIEEKPWVVDDEVVPRKILHIRYSFDERVDDGLTARHGIDTAHRVLSNPFEELGCLEDDGSDVATLDGRGPTEE